MAVLRCVFVFLLLLVGCVVDVVVGGTTQEGLKYLEENSKKDGVVTLPSGLQYRVLRKGDGQFHPGVSTSCSCHYKGLLMDGVTQFDSSYDRGEPTMFAPNQVIKGWTEAMQMMVEGDKWELTIPSELAYGDQGSPPKIPGGAVLVFEMELLEILGQEKVPALVCDVKQPNDTCNERETAYLHKWTERDSSRMELEVKRLAGLAERGSMKPELREWLSRRLHILKQLHTNTKTDEL